MPDKPTTMAVVLYDGFEMLDTFGPLELFNYVPNLRFFVVTEDGKPARIYAGPQKEGVKPVLGTSVEAEYSYENAPKADIVFLPGGYGSFPQEANAKTLEYLEKAGKDAKFVLTVCTGSLILAKTSLLRSRRATSNKAVMAMPGRVGPQTYPGVDWVPKARWVRSEGAPEIWTSSGVAAGIDMAHAFIAQVWGQELADGIATGTEYEPHRDAAWDPFAQEYKI
ncbi:transcriptional regulator [Hyaloraphidium curvatum]|nr:transcriptional regulator [Hyaloraphidium curvatum]